MPEKIVKNLLQLLAADAGIALLHFAQQAFLGGQQNTRAVGVNRAAFEHNAVRRAISDSTSAATPASPSSFATRPGTWSSRCQSEYLAQALKRQLVRATWPSALRTKIGPESRVQLRSVGHWWKLT